jgi:hypothetical protein
VGHFVENDRKDEHRERKEGVLHNVEIMIP